MPKRPFDFAQSQFGLNEKQNAAALKDYLETGGVNLDPATTAWCAAFVNSSLNQAGLPGTNSPAARSFETYGSPVEPQEARQGDLVVQSREDPKNPKAGHVGFYAGPNTRGDTYMLGGNQGRKGEVSLQPFTEQRLLGYRRPPEPDTATAGGGRDSLAKLISMRGTRPGTSNPMQGLPHFLGAVPGNWWEGGGPPRNPSAPPDIGNDQREINKPRWYGRGQLI